MLSGKLPAKQAFQLMGVQGLPARRTARSWVVGNAEVGFLLAGCRAGREQFNRSVSQVKFRLLQIMRSCHSL